jgi:hypothetical protein
MGRKLMIWRRKKKIDQPIKTKFPKTIICVECLTLSVCNYNHTLLFELLKRTSYALIKRKFFFYVFL